MTTHFKKFLEDIKWMKSFSDEEVLSFKPYPAILYKPQYVRRMLRFRHFVAKQRL